MIANAQPKVQIVDTHELPGIPININVAVGVSHLSGHYLTYQLL